ncbi:MAG: hypothetical protein PHU25_01795 [Deltaproteobacteria bacterium]|nr:hypothetical protein [Deltaproteobacteria bacterium]
MTGGKASATREEDGMREAGNKESKARSKKDGKRAESRERADQVRLWALRAIVAGGDHVTAGFTCT